MRLTTAIWLGVFMRRESERGAYVTVVRKGAQQAGAVFVLHEKAGRLFDVYGPAPQSFVEEGLSERRFERVREAVPEDEANLYLERQRDFDPDLWIVETRSGRGEISLEVVS